MTEPTSPTQTSRWSEETIFEVMSNHGRRKIIKALAATGGGTGSDLVGVTGKRLDATSKDCCILVKAGFLRMETDPVDGRKMRYTLDPAVPVAKTETGVELDFGCCLLRI